MIFIFQFKVIITVWDTIFVALMLANLGINTIIASCLSVGNVFISLDVTFIILTTKPNWKI